MMLILGNTFAMGVRERTTEYGVLRALGFMPGKEMSDEEFASLTELERAKVMLAREWAAEICTRMRARPRGTTG